MKTSIYDDERQALLKPVAIDISGPAKKGRPCHPHHHTDWLIGIISAFLSLAALCATLFFIIRSSPSVPSSITPYPPVIGASPSYAPPYAPPPPSPRRSIDNNSSDLLHTVLINSSSPSVVSALIPERLFRNKNLMRKRVTSTRNELTLQTNHVAVSQAVRSVPVSLCLKRSFHFARRVVPGQRLAFHRESLLSEVPSLNVVGSLSALRWSSSGTTVTDSSAISDLPDGYIPEPPLPPPPSAGLTENGTEILQQLNALGEPTLQSLGLGGWWPNGLVQTALEAVHVGLDVPWWTAIVIGTVCLRLAVFPLVILAQRNASNMHNHMPIIQNLQAKFTKARVSGNALEAARAGGEVVDYMKKYKVNPIKNMLVPFIQLPVFISVFVGIRQMANLPVQSMTHGGFAWFTDLTIPDPFYALPLITMATFFITIELGVDGVRAASMTKTLRYVMRAMPFIMLPLIINFPAGMLCYWLTSNLFSLSQVLFLKIEVVRKMFKIPQMVVHDPSIVKQQKKPFIKGMKENWKNSQTMISVEERQRAEAIRFKEAGLGAIKKTYSYDPTKVKSDSATSTKSKRLEHGRLKVKTTAEQQEAKKKERERKLLLYKAATDKIFSKRQKNELDQEMLNLTGELLSTNPDFSTLWNIRRELFEVWLTTKTTDELQKAFTSELYFLEQCLSINPKSYGTWHQRCWVLNRMPEPNWKRELMLCSRFLELDERNFHCWDYRRFVVQRFGVSAETELAFTTTKISSNFSNFSSWHYRSKLLPIVHPDSSQPTGVKTDILQQEFELVQNAFFTDPSDQSAWFYHKWLLGKEQKELSIRSAFVDRQMSKTFVTLTRPAQKCKRLDDAIAVVLQSKLCANEFFKCGKDFALSLAIDDEKMDVTWSSVSGKYSILWIAQLNEEVMNHDKKEFSIKLSLSGMPEKTSLAEIHLDNGDNGYYRKWAPDTFSTATSFFLGQEIDLCKQLHDLEPDNKWVILTLLSLMRALEPERFQDEAMFYLEKLVILDPMRKNYYSDLRSRFILEDALQFCASNVRSFTLTDRQLTAVYHLEQLVRMTSVDLSKNCLTQLRNGHLLQSVQELKLSNNCLTTCDGINNLPCLQVLDLHNNDIKDVAALQALQSCPRLETVILTGNPVMNLPNSLDRIRQVLPRVSLSDCPNVNGEL